MRKHCGNFIVSQSSGGEHLANVSLKTKNENFSFMSTYFDVANKTQLKIWLMAF